MSWLYFSVKGPVQWIIVLFDRGGMALELGTGLKSRCTIDNTNPPYLPCMPFKC